MQADLFNLSISNSFERQAFQRSFFERKHTLRVDQLLAIGLLTIVFFVLVFAWGVEHGKAVSRRDFLLQNQISPLPQKDEKVNIAQSSHGLAGTQTVMAAVEIASEVTAESWRSFLDPREPMWALVAIGGHCSGYRNLDLPVARSLAARLYRAMGQRSQVKFFEDQAGARQGRQREQCVGEFGHLAYTGPNP